MVITSVRTLCLTRLHERERMWQTSRYRTIKADAAIVVIETDEGITGIGEASPYGWPPLIRRQVEWLSQLLIGRDPCDPATAPHPTGASSPHDCAVGGIDTALWDIRSQAAGRPLAALLAPSPQQGVRLYASSGVRYDWDDRPEQVIEETLGYLEQGFTACKLRVGTEWSWSGVTVDRFCGLMRDLSTAVAGRMELMLDGNQRLTEEEALAVGRELGRLGFTWFEEPVPQTDIDAYIRLNAALDVPVTGGEQFTTVQRFEPYLRRGAYRIAQPDVAWCGITEAMRIAELADRHGVDVCPHNWHNGLMTLAHAHYVAALPHPHVLEMCMVQGPLQWEILADPPLPADGTLTLPRRPGLGVRLARDLEARFPHVEGHYAINVER
ncbi:MAG TPA: mandelate racemase/muconate lactonizing enzyme family protein [Candidatus Dormibacteraeota bacterium]|jgi:L-alanine-DL-glutamate epimerase-like enolase superfamily enzyme|nr:mandelate racemase/muconate lactonizing enzyme family protein [Candidatus Dormibacteraeota bacterium]